MPETVHNPESERPTISESYRRWLETQPTRDEYWSLIQNGYEPQRQVIHNALRSVGDVG